MSRPLPQRLRARLVGRGRGITAVCTAHPLAIEAALRHGQAKDTPVLIEATCNQVNQEGGYTGLRPADFRRFVETIVARVGFAPDRLILGGDHLGPNPWKHLAAADAMARAAVLVEAYAQAGFTKLHLDTSMGCAGEGLAPPDEVIAARAAQLAAAAEAAAGPRSGREGPVYVIGTEVPIPGGAQAGLDHVEVTRPAAALQTVEIHRQAFAKAGVEAAFERVVGVVVQPGVEFGHSDVMVYRRAAALDLVGALAHLPDLVFEAHSTDYQPREALSGLVEDGFAILKVGPWLTFALREALYGLDAIAAVLDSDGAADPLPAALERAMLAEPKHWQAYYRGEASMLRLQRHFSYSDRLRYYWPQPAVQAAVDRLTARLEGKAIPETLVSQYLARLYPAVASGTLLARPRDLQVAAVQQVLDLYHAACHGA